MDGERIGCIGHSLGGHNTLFTAAFDPRIKAVVTNCGFTSFPKYYGGNLKGWTTTGYMPRIASDYGTKPEKMPFDFPEVLAAIAPRAVPGQLPGRATTTSRCPASRTASPPRTSGLRVAQERGQAGGELPDCKHDFPAEVRKVAYDWLDRWLK